MTAHPESVVGRLRALEAAHQAATRTHEVTDADGRSTSFSFVDDTDPIFAHTVETLRAAPALLAALEKVWDVVEEYAPTSGAYCCDAAETRDADLVQVRTILAPLFESPEIPNHA